MTAVNELVQPVWQVAWSAAIPQYFFMTGVSAAAFLVSSLTYAFGDARFKPIAGLSLIVALTVLLAAPLNLIADLGQTGRFYELAFATHATAPMSWGVYLLTTYPALILVELLFAFRGGLVARADETTGVVSRVYRMLALGHTRFTASDAARAHAVSRRLALLGIPWALCVHGYTGYILGVMKARPLWHTALMPLVFLISAMVSGVAFMILVTAVMQRFETAERRVDTALLRLLALLLAGFIAADLVLRLFWYSIQWLYGLASYGPVVHHLFVDSFWSAVIVETVLGLAVPLVVALVPALRRRRWALYGASLLAVVGVWVFRWDTVIGGQLVPKVGAGFYTYSPPLWGPDGIMQVVANWGLWLFLFIAATWLLPWQREAGLEEPAERPTSRARTAGVAP
jgi:tetrathionate reductase subunit C